MGRVLAIVVMCAALVLPAAAQRFGGVPASVTSFGFGGRPGFGGVPASVTSPGFGNVPRHFGGVPSVAFFPHNRGAFFKPVFHHRIFPHGFSPAFLHGGFSGGFFPGTVAVPVPVAVPVFNYADYADYTVPQPEQMVVPVQPAQPQPIVIVVPDRDERDKSQPDSSPTPEAREQKAPSPAKPEPPPPPTIVVLRNGEKLELTDYALTGDTLYDLHGGRTKKIAVADIDLPATMKANEERGYEFTLPNAARVHIQ